MWTLAALTIAVSRVTTADPVSGERATRTREQVLALIEEAGATRPDWWSTVPLQYPGTLDLSFPHPPPTEEWNARLNVGQFMWSIVNENESRFRQGTMFMHYVLKLNAGDPGVVGRCREQLAHYKVPRVIRLTASLPRNALGKLQKHQIVEDWLPED